MPIKNCKVCIFIKTNDDLKKCFEQKKELFKNILDSYYKKLENVSKFENKNSDFVPHYYVDNYLQRYQLDFCSYHYFRERIEKHYFFVQKELSEFFSSWIRLEDKRIEEFKFWMIESSKYQIRITNFHTMVDLKLLWAYANHYKHYSRKAEEGVLRILKYAPNGFENSFPEILKNVIKLIETRLNFL